MSDAKVKKVPTVSWFREEPKKVGFFEGVTREGWVIVLLASWLSEAGVMTPRGPFEDPQEGDRFLLWIYKLDDLCRHWRLPEDWPLWASEFMTCVGDGGKSVNDYVVRIKPVVAYQVEAEDGTSLGEFFQRDSWHGMTRFVDAKGNQMIVAAPPYEEQLAGHPDKAVGAVRVSRVFSAGSDIWARLKDARQSKESSNVPA